MVAQKKVVIWTGVDVLREKGNYFHPVTQCCMVLRSWGNAMNTRHGVPGEPALHAVICDRLHNSFLTLSASKPCHGASKRSATTEGPAANSMRGDQKKWRWRGIKEGVNKMTQYQRD